MKRTDLTAQVEEQIKKLVRRLFTEENNPETARQTAEELLAEDFVPIIRRNGQADADRKETVSNYSQPGSLKRHVEQAEVDVALFCDGTVAIARTQLPTTDAKGGDVTYHNTHVFLCETARGNVWPGR